VFVICFDDLADGPPIVLTNIPGATIGTGLESAMVTFSSVPVAGPFPRSYALLETAADFNPPNSDVVSLLDPTSVLFQSDVFSSPPTFGPPAGSLPEDGSFQEFDVSPALSIFMRSDVSSPEPVPEPSSLTLVLLGLLSLAGLALLRSSRLARPSSFRHPFRERQEASIDCPCDVVRRDL
jgi:hypothetical protein